MKSLTRKREKRKNKNFPHLEKSTENSIVIFRAIPEVVRILAHRRKEETTENGTTMEPFELNEDIQEVVVNLFLFFFYILVYVM